MSQKEHPYQDLERLRAWKVLDRAVKRLAENGDLEELTARRYIVGYLLRELQKSQVLAPEVVLVANGMKHVARFGSRMKPATAPPGVRVAPPK